MHTRTVSVVVHRTVEGVLLHVFVLLFDGGFAGPRLSVCIAFALTSLLLPLLPSYHASRHPHAQGTSTNHFERCPALPSPLKGQLRRKY